MVKQTVEVAGLSEVLPGLHVETFVYYAVTTAVDHATAVAAALSTGAQLLDTGYSDPTGTDRISDRIPADAAAQAKSSMQHLAGRAAEAQRLAAEGNEAAARIWADMFGAPFSRPQDGEKAYLQSLHTGACAVTTGATAARRTPNPRAWRPE